MRPEVVEHLRGDDRVDSRERIVDDQDARTTLGGVGKPETGTINHPHTAYD
jgi:hypothetical protein